MRPRSLAVPFALALHLPLLAQGSATLTMSVLVEIRSPTPISLGVVQSLCTSEPVRQGVAQAFGDDLEAATPVAFAPRSHQRNPDLDTVATELRVPLYLEAKTKSELPAARQEAIFAQAVTVLEQALAQRTDEALTRDRKRFEELDQQTLQLEQRYLEQRQRVAALQRIDLGNLQAIQADLERQYLMVELDLKTEQGVQDFLRDATGHAQKQRDEQATVTRKLASERAQLRGLVAGMQRMLDGTKPEETEQARKEFAVLQQKLAEVEAAAAEREPAARRLAEHAEQCAADAQKSTAAILRLMVRHSLLERMLVEQRKKLAEAETAAVERDLAVARADDAKAQLTAVRQRADELRARIAAFEPLRIVRWN